jgi:hypothetical protein
MSEDEDLLMRNDWMLSELLHLSPDARHLFGIVFESVKLAVLAVRYAQQLGEPTDRETLYNAVAGACQTIPEVSAVFVGLSEKVRVDADFAELVSDMNTPTDD